MLDIPNLCVDRLSLAVDSLSARVELDARLANLLQIRAGADVRIGNVDLTIRGLQAQALLLVDLDNVVYVIDQTLTFVDNHPEVVRQLVGVADATARAGAGVLRSIVLGRTPTASGQSSVRSVTETGQLLELVVSATGQVVSERTVGSVLDLAPILETAGALAGHVVRRVQDPVTGQIIEFTLERAGDRVSGVRILRAPDR